MVRNYQVMHTSIGTLIKSIKIHQYSSLIQQRCIPIQWPNTIDMHLLKTKQTFLLFQIWILSTHSYFPIKHSQLQKSFSPSLLSDTMLSDHQTCRMLIFAKFEHRSKFESSMHFDCGLSMEMTSEGMQAFKPVY
jgi:hypothetical protein